MSVQLGNDNRTEDDGKQRVRRVRSTALSKAVSSIPTCGYVDRRDKIDHHVKECEQDMRRVGGEAHSLLFHDSFPQRLYPAVDSVTLVVMLLLASQLPTATMTEVWDCGRENQAL